eukprot:11849536-Alexandrium_andersonii.AAC.1
MWGCATAISRQQLRPSLRDVDREGLSGGHAYDLRCSGLAEPVLEFGRLAGNSWTGRNTEIPADRQRQAGRHLSFRVRQDRRM